MGALSAGGWLVLGAAHAIDIWSGVCTSRPPAWHERAHAPLQLLSTNMGWPARLGITQALSDRDPFPLLFYAASRHAQYKCGADGPSVSWTGCASGTDANYFMLHVNVTCPDWMKRSVTVTLRADVLKNDKGALDVINVDDDAVGPENAANVLR